MSVSPVEGRSKSQQKNIPAQSTHRYHKKSSSRRESGLLEQSNEPAPKRFEINNLPRVPGDW